MTENIRKKPEITSELWKLILQSLESKFDSSNIEVWLGYISASEVNDRLFLTTPNTNVFNYIKKHFLREVKEAAGVFNPNIKVLLVDAQQQEAERAAEAEQNAYFNKLNKDFLNRDTLAVSNDLANSDLFAPLALNKRVVRDPNKWFVNLNKTEMSVSGEQLDYRENRLYAEIIKKGKKNPKEVLEYTRYGLLKEIGVTASGNNYKWLDGALRRLSNCGINYKNNALDKARSVGLIDYFDRDEHRILIKIGEGPLEFFDKGKYALIPHIDKLKSPMASWLYGIVRSNKRGSEQWIILHKKRGDADNVVNLMDMSLRTGGRKNTFRDSVDRAMKELVSIEAVKKYSIDLHPVTKNWILKYTPL